MGFCHEVKKNKALYLLAMPGIVYLILFAYWPMIGLVLAFKDYKIMDGIFGSEWIGLENFRFLFGSEKLFQVIFNTIFLNSIFIVAVTIISVMLALMMNELRSTGLKKLFQTLIFFPYFISWIIISAFAYALFKTDKGLLNNLLMQVLRQTPVRWNQTAALWPAILTFFMVFKYAGFNAIIYMATITSIDPAYYEATRIDGASKMQQIRFITMPLLKPTIVLMVLMSVGRIFFADFGMIYGLVGDNTSLFATTDVIDTFVFRALRNSGDVGMSAATGLFQSVCGLILVSAANRLARRYEADSALF